MRIALIDDNFSDWSGHNAEYALSLVGEAERRGDQIVVFANASAAGLGESLSEIRAIFRQASARLGGRQSDDRWFGRVLRLVRSNVRHFVDLMRGTNRAMENCQLVIIAGNSPRTTAAYGVWLALTAIRGHSWVVAVVLHDRAPWFLGLEMRLLQLLGFRHKLLVAAQSEAIARDCRARFRATVATVPLPFRSLSSSQYRHTSTRVASNVTISFLGLGSSAKGFDFFAEALSIAAVDLESEGFRFLVQCNPIADDPGMQEAVCKVRRVAAMGEAVRLLAGPLSYAQYRQALCDTDIVVLPYDPACYQYIQSGVVAEAISAAKVAVVSSNTALAEELRLYGSSVEFRFGDVLSLTQAIRTAARNFEPLHERAVARRQSYANRHGPGPYMDRMEGLLHQFARATPDVQEGSA